MNEENKNYIGELYQVDTYQKEKLIETRFGLDGSNGHSSIATLDSIEKLVKYLGIPTNEASLIEYSNFKGQFITVISGVEEIKGWGGGPRVLVKRGMSDTNLTQLAIELSKKIK